MKIYGRSFICRYYYQQAYKYNQVELRERDGGWDMEVGSTSHMTTSVGSFSGRGIESEISAELNPVGEGAILHCPVRPDDSNGGTVGHHVRGVIPK